MNTPLLSLDLTPILSQNIPPDNSALDRDGKSGRSAKIKSPAKKRIVKTIAAPKQQQPKKLKIVNASMKTTFSRSLKTSFDQSLPNPPLSFRSKQNSVAHIPSNPVIKRALHSRNK